MSWDFSPEKRLWPRVKKRGRYQCWEWQGSKTKAGYGILTIKYQNYYAHRLAWELHNKKSIPESSQICHTCDNPACCNPRHLFLGTATDNLNDASKKGRIQHGSKHSSAKLTDAEVRKIKQLYNDGVSVADLVGRFDVARQTLNDIVWGRTWKHIKVSGTSIMDRSKGTDHPKAKLQDRDVKKIRELHQSGLSQYKIASQFHVSRGTIEAIIKGKTWKHVK